MGSSVEDDQRRGAKRAVGATRVFVLMLVLMLMLMLMVVRLRGVRFYNDLSSQVDVGSGSRGGHGGQRLRCILQERRGRLSLARTSHWRTGRSRSQQKEFPRETGVLETQVHTECPSTQASSE
ncbi:hypothetical protein FJTKL_13970 [Diaporthe vaccinii]|uniref:Uncharacterized protein n=1 Tax=Diaporthe vaccinii TaxID=105482 RepID=A0ABR4FA28_9PEZI